MGQPRQIMAAVSRNDGTIQSWRLEREDTADLRGLLPLDRSEGTDPPWRWSLSMRSSRRRPSTMAR